MVQAIAFISESMDSINKCKQLSEKICETKILLGKLRLEELELVNKFHQKLINQHETNIQSIKEFKPNINLNIEDPISNFDKFQEDQNLKISKIKETEKIEIELKKNEIDQAMLKLLALRDEYDKMFDQNS